MYVNLQNANASRLQFNSKQFLYGLTNVKTDANGAGWIPFNPNFRDENTFFLVGLIDKNMIDRVVVTCRYNGAEILLFKDGDLVRNANGWLNWLAIGNAL